MPLAISIDNLLDAYRGDEIADACGKLGIVKCILEAERKSQLYFERSNLDRLDSRRAADSWFAGFIRVWTESVSFEELDSSLQNVSIINFNYDRCIEHYLHSALQSYYGVTAEEIVPILKKIKIIHPYGQVGLLPWQGTQSVPYGAENVDLLAITQQIKTFNEGIEDEVMLNSIKNCFQSAELIVFLGFAFHRQNLELISPGGPCSAKKVFATAYGISASDCKVIKDEIMGMLNPNEYVEIVVHKDLKCADMFREYWRSLSARRV